MPLDYPAAPPVSLGRPLEMRLWTCSLSSGPFLPTFPSSLWTWEAGESAAGLQAQGRCGETGRLWPGHRGGGGAAGMVW